MIIRILILSALSFFVFGNVGAQQLELKFFTASPLDLSFGVQSQELGHFLHEDYRYKGVALQAMEDEEQDIYSHYGKSKNYFQGFEIGFHPKNWHSGKLKTMLLAGYARFAQSEHISKVENNNESKTSFTAFNADLEAIRHYFNLGYRVQYQALSINKFSFGFGLAAKLNANLSAVSRLNMRQYSEKGSTISMSGERVQLTKLNFISTEFSFRCAYNINESLYVGADLGLNSMCFEENNFFDRFVFTPLYSITLGLRAPWN